MTLDPALLYVEDDPKSRKVMEMTLKLGMKLTHVTIFDDSANFVERVKAIEPRPEVIFLDIHVKPHSGFELLEMLRQMDQFKNVPIVALTASVMNEEVLTLRTAGFDGCFAKPLDIEVFPDNLRRVLNGEHIWRII